MRAYFLATGKIVLRYLLKNRIGNGDVAVEFVKKIDVTN
jgi:hypothetical protein